MSKEECFRCKQVVAKVIQYTASCRHCVEERNYPAGYDMVWTCMSCANEITQEEIEAYLEPRRGFWDPTYRNNARQIGGTYSAQVGESEATAVAIHPVTGEIVYCFNEDPRAEMPEVYKKEGFERKTFNHYRELDQFCKDNGLVNDKVEGYHKDDGFFEENLAKRQKAEKERVERYMEEREKARKAMR